jgi:hypothetical protein
LRVKVMANTSNFSLRRFSDGYETATTELFFGNVGRVLS